MEIVNILAKSPSIVHTVDKTVSNSNVSYLFIVEIPNQYPVSPIYSYVLHYRH